MNTKRILSDTKDWLKLRSIELVQSQSLLVEAQRLCKELVELELNTSKHGLLVQVKQNNLMRVSYNEKGRP